MTATSETYEIIDVTAANVEEFGTYCIKNKKAPGYHKKIEWFKKKLNDGLKIKIALDSDGKQQGFIEFIPAENAWRPITADGYYFIQCIVVFSKKVRNQQIGSLLINACIEEAKPVSYTHLTLPTNACV